MVRGRGRFRQSQRPFARLGGVRIVAPYLILAEIANALHRKVADGQIALQLETQVLESLDDSEIEFHNQPSVHAGAGRLANQLSQRAAYDCIYIALAERLDCELWTAARRFHRSARRAFPDCIRRLSEIAAP